MNTSKTKILVFRFSAMGDVAMTAPILKEFSEQNPETELLIVSRTGFEPFFQSVPNAKFIGINLEDYKGIFGLRKLASELASYRPDMIADLHSVLRTRILKLFLSFSVKHIASLDKGRKKRKALTQKHNKILQPIRSIPERYADVFRELGFSLKLSHRLSYSGHKKEDTIGVAPFAKYQEKMYPLERMQNICIQLAEKGTEIYLFGGGKDETEILRKWEKSHANIHFPASEMSLEEQMVLISTLSLMLSMDSANMHIASLCGTRVISVWGATHPFAGFLGYGQKEDDIIQINTLNCRPCSIFGNKPCYRKDLACMKEIKEDDIIQKLSESVKKS